MFINTRKLLIGSEVTHINNEIAMRYRIYLCSKEFTLAQIFTEIKFFTFFLFLFEIKFDFSINFLYNINRKWKEKIFMKL